MNNIINPHHLSELIISSNRLQCPNYNLHHDHERKCVFKNVVNYNQNYFTFHWMGIKKSCIKSCIIHNSTIDLLRDRNKITFGDNGMIIDKKLNQTQTLDKEIISIALTTKSNVSRRRTMHFTRNFMIKAWMALMHRPNMQFLYDQIILNYAQHAHQIYLRKVSMTRLVIEAASIFMSKTTFFKLMTSYFRERAKRCVLQTRHLISLYPYRIVALDGNRKFAQKLYIQSGKSRHQSNCTYNTLLAASTGFIISTLIYSDGKENQERMTEMMLKPLAYSVQHSPLHKPLVYGIGIDHPQRDYSLGDYFQNQFKQHLISINKIEKKTTFISKRDIKYDLEILHAFVKFIFFIQKFLLVIDKFYVISQQNYIDNIRNYPFHSNI